MNETRHCQPSSSLCPLPCLHSAHCLPPILSPVRPAPFSFVFEGNGTTQAEERGIPGSILSPDSPAPHKRPQSQGTVPARSRTHLSKRLNYDDNPAPTSSSASTVTKGLNYDDDLALALGHGRHSRRVVAGNLGVL